MTALRKIVQIVGLAMFLVVVLALFEWSTLCRIRIENDLRTFAHAVRQSELTLHDKERLLDVIERLEDRSKSGEQIDFRVWFQHRQTIHEMLDDEIKTDEVRLIERETFADRTRF